jgi:hypothetical protein
LLPPHAFQRPNTIGKAAAVNRDLAASKLTPAQISEARRPRLEAEMTGERLETGDYERGQDKQESRNGAGDLAQRKQQWTRQQALQGQ